MSKNQATEQSENAQTMQSEIDAAINFVPKMFPERMLGALTRKYAAKYGKFPSEQAAHAEMFPAFAGNTAMLYILVSAQNEASEKLASEERMINVANLTGMVNSYVHTLGAAGEVVLTDYQVHKNEQTDSEIVSLRDKVASATEQSNLLKAVRATWLKSIDYNYVRAQDNKLRRACHIFGTTLEAIAR